MKDRLGIFLMNWRVRVVLPYLRGDVLDIGCGTNELLETYKAKHGECYTVGIDVYPWEGVDHVVPNSAVLPFEDKSFDTVCCIAALNHIPEREAVLRETWRVLRPKGRLVLTMLPPVISYVWHTLRAPWDADQHERGMSEGEVLGFTQKEILNLLCNADFALRESRPFMWGVNRLYVAEKSAKDLI